MSRDWWIVISCTQAEVYEAGTTRHTLNGDEDYASVLTEQYGNVAPHCVQLLYYYFNDHR